MMKIRTKLLVYFLAVIIIAIILFFIREESAQRIVDLHDESSEHYFLLNEISSATDQTFRSLQIYVHEPIDENAHYYREDKEQLLALQQEFQEQAAGGIEKQNYLHLLTSFLELTDQTVDAVDNDNVEQYSYYLNEADNTATYISEKTLELINKELTRYQSMVDLTDQAIQNAKNIGTAIFISVIIVSILFAVWFSEGITKTIRQLTKAAKEISKGNYTGQDVVVSQKDELKILTDSFNQMRRDILQSVNEMEEKAQLAQLLKEMELKSLQNQINPHFLFNTLNTISKLSYIEGAEKTSDLISSVSTLLRYNIGNIDRQTYLEDEVKIVNEYFFIQKTRFGDRVSFHQNIDEDCLNIEIPCLTIQPIIENAFMHGIEEMAQDAEIRLDIYQDEAHVYIDITDNGIGMDQEMVQRLLGDDPTSSSEQKGHSTGIGMRNVMDRLKLVDKDSVVSIHSELGKGTTVSIQLQKGAN